MCNSCDVARAYAQTVKVPAKDWKLTRIVDRGPSEYYRFHIEGENLNYPPGYVDRRFAWSVRDIDDPRYDVDGAIRETRAKGRLS